MRKMLPEKGAEKREGQETQHPLQGADSERRDELIITEAVSGLWKRGWKYGRVEVQIGICMIQTFPERSDEMK